MRQFLVIALVIAVVSCQSSDEGTGGGGGLGAGYQAPAPTYEEPSYGYEAPSYGYEQPSYGYEAPAPQGYYVREPGKMERFVAKWRGILNRMMDKKQAKAERFSNYRFVPYGGYGDSYGGYGQQQAAAPSFGNGFGLFDGGESK